MLESLYTDEDEIRSGRYVFMQVDVEISLGLTCVQRASRKKKGKMKYTNIEKSERYY